MKPPEMSIWQFKDKGINFQFCVSEKENVTKDMTNTYRKTSASNSGQKEGGRKYKNKCFQLAIMEHSVNWQNASFLPGKHISRWHIKKSDKIKPSDT